MEGELHCCSWESCPRDDGAGKVARVKCPRPSHIKYALIISDMCFSHVNCSELFFCCSVAIVHGDYRLGNLVFDPTEVSVSSDFLFEIEDVNYQLHLILCAQPKVNAVLDWEICALGDPLADVGFFAMTFLPFPSPLSLGECCFAHLMLAELL